MNDHVIRALLCEKAEALRKRVREQDPEEREMLDATIALLDLQIRKLRERRELRSRVIVAPIRKVG